MFTVFDTKLSTVGSFFLQFNVRFRSIKFILELEDNEKLQFLDTQFVFPRINRNIQTVIIGLKLELLTNLLLLFK